MKNDIAVWLSLLILAGCGYVTPQKPGKSAVKLAPVNSEPNGKPVQLASTYELVQPENPATPATQTIERTHERVEAPRTPTVQGEPPRPVVTDRTVEKVQTVIGAAQKDTARELGARLASLRSVQWVGIFLILAAVAMLHPFIFAFTMSRTLQAVTGATGLVLVILPTLVASNPMLFSAAALVGVAIPLVWFIAHRHGAKGTLSPPS